MHWLATIKFPSQPGVLSYKIARAHWINTWCKIIQAGMANAVAPHMAHNYTQLVLSYYTRSQNSDIRSTELPSITHLPNLHSYQNGDIIHTDEQAFGKENINGGENETCFDTFYADGGGLAWRKDNGRVTTHIVNDDPRMTTHMQDSTEAELTQHDEQRIDKSSKVNKVSCGETGSILRGQKLEIGDKVIAAYKVKGNKVKLTEGIVSKISKNGYVKLQDYGRWSKVVQTLLSVEEHEDSNRRTPNDMVLKGISVKVGDKVKIYAGRSKQLIGIVCTILKKGTVKLRDYGKWSRVIGLFKCNDNNDGFRGRDSEKTKIR